MLKETVILEKEVEGQIFELTPTKAINPCVDCAAWEAGTKETGQCLCNALGTHCVEHTAHWRQGVLELDW